jgi:hypothetical protein
MELLLNNTPPNPYESPLHAPRQPFQHRQKKFPQTIPKSNNPQTLQLHPIPPNPIQNAPQTQTPKDRLRRTVRSPNSHLLPTLTNPPPTDSTSRPPSAPNPSPQARKTTPPPYASPAPRKRLPMATTTAPTTPRAHLRACSSSSARARACRAGWTRGSRRRRGRRGR